MAVPAVESFLELVRKSGLLEENRVTAYLDGLHADGAIPVDPGRLAGRMVRDGLLTEFQAEQLLAGKWRGFHIGKYKILERLGSGGMGTVYLAEHKFMKRRVAVKVLPKSKASDPASLERFYREAKAVAALDHSNIVRAFDIDQEGDLHYIVMEYVDGSSLQDIVRVTGPMDVNRACHYVQQAADALQHAHEVGLVHRDIKPGNVLVDRRGLVKILDMGLARFFNDSEDMITKKYDENVLGTADYLAPEQAIDSHSVDIRADIYSLGATFYFILAGKAPFGDGTVSQKLIWHQTRLPKPLRELRPELPPELVAVVQKMMSKDASHRYQFPSEIVAALQPWTRTPPSLPSDDELPKLSPAASSKSGSDETKPARPDNTAVADTIPWTPSPAPLTPRPTKNSEVSAPPPASVKAEPSRPSFSAVKSKPASSTKRSVGAGPAAAAKSSSMAVITLEQIQAAVNGSSPKEKAGPKLAALETPDPHAPSTATVPDLRLIRPAELRPARPRRTWLLAGTAAALVAIAGFVAWALTSSELLSTFGR